jgi:hypothetical protein
MSPPFLLVFSHLFSGLCHVMEHAAREPARSHPLSPARFFTDTCIIQNQTRLEPPLTLSALPHPGTG